MKIPTEISFNGIDHSDALELCVLRWVARLEQLCDRITGCTVTIALPHRRHRRGKQFSVSVVLAVPGTDVAVTHHHEDVYVAVADTFRTVRRQLVEARHIQRVKRHVTDVGVTAMK